MPDCHLGLKAKKMRSPSSLIDHSQKIPMVYTKAVLQVVVPGEVVQGLGEPCTEELPRKEQ